MKSIRAAHLGIILLAIGACAPRPAQEPFPMTATPAPVSGAFVLRLGTDTVAIERFTRTGNTIEGDVATRVGAVRITHYVATLAPDGTVQRVDATVRQGSAPADAPPMMTTALQWSGDTAVVMQRRNDSTRTITAFTGAGAIPFFGYSYMPYDLLLSRAAVGGADSIVMYSVGSRTPWGARVHRTADSAHITTNNGVMHAAVNASGQITGFRIVGGTFQLAGDRVATVDFPGLIGQWVAAEAAGRGIRQLSPADSVRATIGTVSVSIDYHAPSLRGRTIFGALLPWDTVWRTGANEATTLRTSGDLLVGGTRVPAGTYTIWTVPSRSGWTLILNKQTGQWGTVYNAAQDLARIPMQVRAMSPLVERLRIGVTPGAPESRLTIAWEGIEASVPLRTP